MKGLALAVAVGGLLMAVPIAAAQDTSGYPGMRGQLKGTNDGVVLGSGMYHREGGSPGEPRMVSKEFTLNIKGQEGRKFWGELVSKDDTGPFLGVMPATCRRSTGWTRPEGMSPAGSSGPDALRCAT
jgi:hypothetical protein